MRKLQSGRTGSSMRRPRAAKTSTSTSSRAPGGRFQFDAQWQKDFGKLIDERVAMRKRVEAGVQYRDAGKLDKARRELELADEAKERAELLEHKLRDLT